MLNRALARAVYRDYIADNYAIGDASEYILTRRNIFKELYVNNETNLIIEGYPRSGANYYAALVKSHCKQKISVSFRRHTKHQIKKGIRIEVPIVILLRNPLDSCSSYYISVNKKISLNYIISQYIRYYSFVRDNLSKLTLCSFDTLKSDANALLALASDLTGLEFESEMNKTKANDYALSFYDHLAQSKGDKEVVIREAPLPTGWKDNQKEKVSEDCRNTDGYIDAYKLYLSLKNDCI